MSGAASERYERIALLGQGGMAEVWKARLKGPAGFARTVVVKRILPHRARDEAFVKMFLAEARLSARLQHPNIVTVFELGETKGEYFMVMEYVHGVELGRVITSLRERGPLPIGFSVSVIRDVCRALAYAHALRDEDGRPLHIVHRDVSPSNVMISSDGVVKLLDFGIAKALGAAESDVRTETGALKGKFGYLSPEQVLGQAIDRRSDLFAAAVVLHELLTGQRLFRAATELETLNRVRDAVVAPPSRVNAAVPDALDAVCLRALAREPDARYATCDAFADALEPFVDGWTSERSRALIAELLPTDTTGAPAASTAASPESPATATGSVPPATESDVLAVPRPWSDREAQRKRVARWPWAILPFAASAAIAAFVLVAKRQPSSVASSPPVLASVPAPGPTPSALATAPPLSPNAPPPPPPKPEPPRTAVSNSRTKRTEPKRSLPPKPAVKDKRNFDPEAALPL